MAAQPPSSFWWVGCQNHPGQPSMNQQKAIDNATDMTYHNNTCVIQIFLVGTSIVNEYVIVPPVPPSLVVKT